MRNTNAVTETMNIQLRQTKFRYWRGSNVRSAGSVSTLLGILNPTFIIGSVIPEWCSDEFPTAPWALLAADRIWQYRWVHMLNCRLGRHCRPLDICTS